jgi:deoxyribonuclease IV
MTSPDNHLLLGAHFSIAGGLHHAILEARSYRCNALQLFTKNATTWRERMLSEGEIQKFKEVRNAAGILQTAAHSSYLINIAGGEEKKISLSRKALKQELVRCGQLDIDFLVLHPGSHMGSGEKTGMMRIAQNINRVFDETEGVRTRLLIETTAGQGTGIGSSFEQLAQIIQRIQDDSRIGICMDTCHIFAAGYDISSSAGYRKAVKAFDEIIGLKHLHLIHVNDSKKEAGSRVDRHEHIGSGFIGINTFKLLINDIRFRNIPKIIETPKGKLRLKDWDKINLNRLRRLKSS